jgi:hypothetical protein
MTNVEQDQLLRYFMQEEFPEGLTYGIGTYHEGEGYATGQTPRQFFDRQRK